MAEEHYFTADPVDAVQAGARARQRVGPLAGADLGLRASSPRAGSTSAPACCCGEVAPPVEAREVLDLGCGYGVIGLAVALAVPEARVTAVDVNERALLLADENAERLGVADRFRAVLPDEVDPEATYDEIWSNPPIRVGKDALHELLLQWLPRLTPGGPRGDGRRQEPRLGLAVAGGWASRATRPRSWPAPRASGCWRRAGRPSGLSVFDQPQGLQRAGVHRAAGVLVERARGPRGRARRCGRAG